MLVHDVCDQHFRLVGGAEVSISKNVALGLHAATPDYTQQLLTHVKVHR